MKKILRRGFPGRGKVGSYERKRLERKEVGDESGRMEWWPLCGSAVATFRLIQSDVGRPKYRHFSSDSKVPVWEFYVS